VSAAVVDRLFDQDRDPDQGPPWTLLRWALCFAVIAALHVGGVWAALHWHPADKPVPLPPAAVMIDLSPLPAAPSAPPSEIPPGPKQEVSQPPPPEPEAPQPVLPPAPPSPAPRIDVPLPPESPAPVPKIDVSPPPKPKPLPHPRQQIVPHEPPQPQPDIKPPAPVTTAPPQVQAPPAPTVAAPAPGAAVAPSARAVPTWQALLLRRLEQFKRYPSSAQAQHQQGAVYLRFTMDRGGRVLSARIDKSSGFQALDEEALALVHRAEPLPPPPPEIPGNPLELVVPVQFFLK
jgi:protein TonB